MAEMNPRQRVLAIFEGKAADRPACFSGMGNVTVAGLEQCGYRFPDLHGDPRKMADAAASSYRLFGLECAVVPFDLCVEAEALGCVMNPYAEVEQILYPTIKEKVVHGEEEMTTFPIPDRITTRGRVPVVAEAIQRLKREVGAEIAIGTYVLGPFTLAGQLMDLDHLFKLAFKKQDLVNAMLDRLTGVLLEIADYYRAAGADYVTVREMGATMDVLSPRVFRAVIFPHLQRMFSRMAYPKVLHICGGTNGIVGAMWETAPDAISVEQKNDLQKTRADIGWDPLVFGNVDAYNVLVGGDAEAVRQAVTRSLEGGVDAVWPSCDVWPTAPVNNMRAMVDTVRKLGATYWKRARR